MCTLFHTSFFFSASIRFYGDFSGLNEGRVQQRPKRRRATLPRGIMIMKLIITLTFDAVACG